MSGPLADVLVVEVGGIGPSPFAAMVLADFGATVLRVERRGGGGIFDGDGASTVINRGRAVLELDLKDSEDRAVLLDLADNADVLLEGFRPGVMERLGLGPSDVHDRNPRLVYGRMTGYGQDGPLAQAAGHDINYVAMSGALSAMARQDERPMFPLNLLGDYGGGGMQLAVGVLAALHAARASGRGQVVDAAMTEGVGLLSSAIHGLKGAGVWHDAPGTNVLDSGAPFYEVYRCADGRDVAVGAIEPQFYAHLLAGLDIAPEDAPQWQRAAWPSIKTSFAERFAAHPRDHWLAAFDDVDACVTPVLTLDEASQHPHAIAREAFIDANGVRQPAPAPRFSATPATVRATPPVAETLERFGLSTAQIDAITGVTDGQLTTQKTRTS